MRFTYQGYKDMLSLLKEKEYAFCSYHDWDSKERCVILRHDIDNSLEQAVRMAELEAECGVSATYFVLLRTDFYNVASKKGWSALAHIQDLGHEIGLHFDETSYGRMLSQDEVKESILKECRILSELLDSEVSTVSMHRPSKATLEANLEISGLVNSYGETFFHDFKYLSDSRRCWRESVMDIIRSGEHSRLHILTHAFWYHEREKLIGETAGDFIRAANGERYSQMKDNITDFASILSEEEI